MFNNALSFVRPEAVDKIVRLYLLLQLLLLLPLLLIHIRLAHAQRKTFDLVYIVTLIHHPISETVFNSILWKLLYSLYSRDAVSVDTINKYWPQFIIVSFSWTLWIFSIYTLKPRWWLLWSKLVWYQLQKLLSLPNKPTSQSLFRFSDFFTFLKTIKLNEFVPLEIRINR